MFFVLDGIDGVGKSTQIERLVGWLREQGRVVTTCRDPGSTPLGESLRDLLLHSGEDRPIGPRAEMLLYMAARAQLVDQVIRPALERGETVVSDRFLIANLAYQAHAGGLDRSAVAGVGAIAIDGVQPDLTMVLDLDQATADQRRSGTPDRMEQRDGAYRTRIRDGFLAEARLDPQRVAVIDAAGTPDEVHQAIRDAVRPLLG